MSSPYRCRLCRTVTVRNGSGGWVNDKGIQRWVWKRDVA